jgi:rhodanese-related sulfurtransferase
MKRRIVLFFIAVLVISSCSNAQLVKETSSDKGFEMLKSDKNIIVLDVRTADEFNSGHIKGAINIDVKLPDAFEKIDKLDHNSKYIVHCRTNHRSKVAVDHMLQSGFKDVYQMMDGMNGWSGKKLPVEK